MLAGEAWRGGCQQVSEKGLRVVFKLCGDAV